MLLIIIEVNALFQTEEMRLLVVDQDQDLVHSFARVLRLSGYFVDEAVSDQEAVRLAHEHCPRVVFLNYSTDRPGNGARRQIEEVCPGVIVVLIVASEIDLQSIRATGALVFRKPFELAGLLEALETLGRVKNNLPLAL